MSKQLLAPVLNHKTRRAFARPTLACSLFPVLLRVPSLGRLEHGEETSPSPDRLRLAPTRGRSAVPRSLI